MGAELGASELERTKRLADKITRLQPQRLRMCSTECPMRDMCVWITTQEQHNWPDVRGLRCPIEADLWAKGFDTWMNHVYSMDPDRSPPTNFEIALCKDIAWKYVEEHRVITNTAHSPEPIINSVVPGTEGLTAEQPNPRLASLASVRKDLNKAIDQLTKSVERRLKNVKEQREIYVKTVTAVQEEMKNNPEKYKGTRLGGLLETMSERVEKNEEERAKAEEEKSG